MRRRTKIVCTLGPATSTKDKIKELIEAGMNVARINCSHICWDSARQWVHWIRELSGDYAPVAILADLQGPKFRLGEVLEGGMPVHTGESYTFGLNPGCDLPIQNQVVYDGLKINDRVLIGDGYVELCVASKLADRFVVNVVTSGVVKSRQGITVVGRSFDAPSLSEKDLYDLKKACELGVDFIAQSYVRTADDVHRVRGITENYNPYIKICAKIEQREAVDNIDSILKASDLVMVARGDLGLQMEIEQVPLVQKQVITQSFIYGRPVITATQMLESMVSSSRPTRAEATDVANAVLDGTDAVMLSQETAIGNYPIQAVKTMANIAEHAEKLFRNTVYLEHLNQLSSSILDDTESVALAAVQLASSIQADAIIATSTSGTTPEMIAQYRPDIPVLCASWNEHTKNQMAVIWGVEAIHIPFPKNTDEIVQHAVDSFYKHGVIKEGQTVVVTAGTPPGKPGTTNLIMVYKVQDPSKR